MPLVDEIDGLTRNHISRIHRIIILDEAEAVHQLDLCDVTSAMSLEVGLDVLLRHCSSWMSSAAILGSIVA